MLSLLNFLWFYSQGDLDKLQGAVFHSQVWALVLKDTLAELQIVRWKIRLTQGLDSNTDTDR